MFDRYGMAVVEERLHDRRLSGLEDYLRMEYGSTSGIEWYLAEANHASPPGSRLRAFLAKIVGVASRSSTRGAPAASVEPAFSEESGHATPQPQAAMAPQVSPLGYRRGHDVQPRTAPPPLKR